MCIATRSKRHTVVVEDCGTTLPLQSLRISNYQLKQTKMTWDKYGTPCHIQVIAILLVSIGTMLSDVPRSRDLWLNAHLMAISWALPQMLISRWPNPIPAWRVDETPENSSNHWKTTEFIPHPKPIPIWRPHLGPSATKLLAQTSEHGGKPQHLFAAVKS